MKNFNFLQKSLNDITLELFEKVYQHCIRKGIVNTAPLGSSGDTMILFENKYGCSQSNLNRCCQVSLRLYGDSPELLITNYEGYFLFYGRFDISLDQSFIIEKYYGIFLSLKNLIK